MIKRRTEEKDEGWRGETGQLKRDKQEQMRKTFQAPSR
jgi:hypothetical protein